MNQILTDSYVRTNLVHCRLEDVLSVQAFAKPQESVMIDEKIQEVIRACGLKISKAISLQRPFYEITPYLQKELALGKYVIPLHNKVSTLIKDAQGKLSLFDPDQGVIDLNSSAGRDRLMHLLHRNKVHIRELLTLYKVDGLAGAARPMEYEQVTHSEPEAQLSFEAGEGRWGIARFTWRGKTMSLQWDQKTGYVYNDDSISLLRKKLVLLIPQTAIVGTIRTAYHVAMAALRIVAIPIALLQGISDKRRLIENIRKIHNSVCDIFRAPLYAFLGIGAAIYGVFNPLNGRRLYGSLERTLNRQGTHVDFHAKHYVAPCFKPLNFNSDRGHSETAAAIKRYMLLMQFMPFTPTVELFCGWRHSLPCFYTERVSKFGALEMPTFESPSVYTEGNSNIGISSCAKIPADQKLQTTQY